MKSLCYIEEFIFNRQNGMNSVMSCEKTQTVARRAVVLEYFDSPGKNVAVAGSFNDWQPVKILTDKKGDGRYSCRLMLTPGTYQYKFMVDGEWRSDSANPNFIPNEYGSLNSVLEIRAK